VSEPTVISFLDFIKAGKLQPSDVYKVSIESL